jgi:hypothetical protein
LESLEDLPDGGKAMFLLTVNWPEEHLPVCHGCLSGLSVLDTVPPCMVRHPHIKGPLRSSVV